MGLTKILYELGPNRVQEIVDGSNSVNAVFRKCGVRDVGGNRRTFYSYIEKNNLSLDKLQSNRKEAFTNLEFTGVKPKEFGEIFCKDSDVRRSIVKRFLLREELIDYGCSICGIRDVWNNKELVLHLDHINGIGNDNRLENLRFLCPNCHSQTETYAGKNKPGV